MLAQRIATTPLRETNNMDASSQISWMDDFLFWDFIVVTMLVAVDWLLGEERRNSMRDTVGYWWIHAENIGYGELAAEDASIMRCMLVWLLGNGWFTARRISSSILVGIILAITVGFVFVVVTPSDRLAVVPFVAILLVTCIIALPTAISCWLSFSLTIIFLGWMVKRPVLWFYVFIVLIDIVALALILYLGGSLTTISIGEYSPRLLNYTSSANEGWEDVFHDTIGVFALANRVLPVFVVVAAIPTVLHISYVLFLTFCKAFRRILGPVVGLLLKRLHESRQGVLTVIAAGCGVFAKLVQESAKYLLS